MAHVLAQNILQPDATAIIVFLMTLLLVWVLDRTLFQPVLRVLDERERRTHGFESEAKAILAECDHKFSHYEDVIRRTRAEGYRLIEERRQQALSERDRLIAETKGEMAEAVKRAKEDVREQVIEAKRHLEAEAVRLAQDIVSTVVGRRLEEVTRVSS